MIGAPSAGASTSEAFGCHPHTPPDCIVHIPSIAGDVSVAAAAINPHPLGDLNQKGGHNW
jgi:hypothetical protein